MTVAVVQTAPQSFQNFQGLSAFFSLFFLFFLSAERFSITLIFWLPPSSVQVDLNCEYGEFFHIDEYQRSPQKHVHLDVLKFSTIYDKGVFSA